MQEEVMEVATEAAVETATSGRKSGLVIGVCAVATLGVAYGVYAVAKKIKARKAKNTEKATEEKEA